MCVLHVYCSYENPDIALNCGVMLRECVKHEPLARLILESDDFFLFYKYVEVSTFDIASDAFSTFKVSTVVPTVSVMLVFINWRYVYYQMLSNKSSYCIVIGPFDKTQALVCSLFRAKLRQSKRHTCILCTCNYIVPCMCYSLPVQDTI